MTQSARKVEVSKQTDPPAPLKLVPLVPPAEHFKRAEQLLEEISRRAFEIFERNGRPMDRDLENWLRAESELLHPVHIDIAESNGDVTVLAEVPGFAASELDLSVEPSRLTITGKRETNQERKDQKTVYSECTSDQLLRVIELPAAVDPAKASANLKNGVLEVRMGKAAPAKKVPVSVKQPNQDREC